MLIKIICCNKRSVFIDYNKISYNYKLYPGAAKMQKRIPLVLIILAVVALTAYLLYPSMFKQSMPVAQKELLIFCGITMIKPISEIAAIIEQQEQVKVSIIKGGSGNLLKSIRFNQTGDLYLPGSESYIKQANAEGLIMESVHVGYNKAAMMVQKGNPRAIKAELSALTNEDYYVVIGNPDSGSIGKETKKILTAANLFDQVMVNSQEMTTDSKRLIDVLKKGEADLVINWYATSSWAENKPYVDALSIDGQFAEKKRLVMGLLSSSKHPDIASKFMAYAGSEKGRKIFDRYGLYNIH
jgi:molybdate transport system substrate-binding protein